MTIIAKVEEANADYKNRTDKLRGNGSAKSLDSVSKYCTCSSYFYCTTGVCVSARERHR